MATYTSKLNLKKPLGTEHVSRSDMNDNYDKIDAGVVTNVDGEISNSLLIGVRASGSSIGARSMAIGGNVEASGSNSFACGNGAKASGSASHAEQSANATGYHSHAENASTASGEGSHAENQGTAYGSYSHAENYGYAKGKYSHAEGYGTYAKSKGQHVSGKHNVYDPTGDYDEFGTYAEIIGNGTNAGAAYRSNARALDWDGNEYLMGDLYVGCNADSTGGTKVPTTPFSGASSSTAGSAGLVPAPAAGDQNKVLKGDGTWGEMDASGKADKVASATSGNFAGLDSNGNLTDSGKSPDDMLELDADLEDSTKAAPADVVGQLALMKTDHIYNETEPSAICSVSDGAALPIKTLIVSIEPVQDLHGYDSPWSGGGGKNLLPLNDGTYTVGNAVTAVIKDGVMTMSGTATTAGGRLVAMTDDFVLPAGTYFINTNRSGSDVTVYINKKSDNTAINQGDNRNFTLSEDTIVFAGINVTIGKNYNGVTAKPMLNVGNTSIPFEPYENVCPISGWDSAAVSRTGKNLFDVNRTQGTPDPSTGDYSTSPRKMDTSHFYVGLRPDNYYYPTNVSSWSVSDGAVSIVGANNAYGIGFPVSVKPNTSYCFSAVASGNPYIGVGFYDAEWHYISAINNDTTTTLNFITPYNAAYAVIVLRSTDTSVGTTWTNIQLELGSTATSYEPYSGSTAEYEFPQEAGTVYGGSLTIHQDGSGELVVNLANVEKTSADTSGVGRNDATKYYIDTNNGKQNGIIISNQFSSSKYECWINSGGDIRFDTNAEYSSVSEMIADLGSIQFVYELATPVTYQLTNQQVLSLLKGNNVVFADCGAVSLEYPADTKLYIDGKIAEIQALILENISNS